jgi:hypothetical protein
MPDKLTAASVTAATVPGSGAAPIPIKDRLSIATTYYMLSSAPRLTVLRKTITRLRKYLPETAGCRHLIYYHEPDDRSPKAMKHLDNLRRFCDQFGLELVVRPDSGVKVNMIEAVDTIDTPYMLFLEYDLAFRKHVDLPRLLDAFDKYPFINYVHFSPRANDSLYQWGHLIAPEERVSEVPLTRTSCWSNQAHVVRVRKWHDEWLAIIGRDKPSHPMYGLEEKMYWAYNRDIFTEGFYEANNRWGVYFYGDIRAKPKIAHINGAIHTGTIREYVNKAKRYMSRTISSFRD